MKPRSHSRALAAAGVAPLRQLVVYSLLALVTLGLGIGGLAYNIGYVVQETRNARTSEYWTRVWEMVLTADFAVGILLSIFPVFFGLAILGLCWSEYRAASEWKSQSNHE